MNKPKSADILKYHLQVISIFQNAYSYIIFSVLVNVNCFYRACLGLPAQNYMMLEHKVPSLMAGMTEEKVSTVVPTTTKPLVKSLPSQANENRSATLVENGAPHLNGNVSNGVH